MPGITGREGKKGSRTARSGDERRGTKKHRNGSNRERKEDKRERERENESRAVIQKIVYAFEYPAAVLNLWPMESVLSFRNPFYDLSEEKGPKKKKKFLRLIGRQFREPEQTGLILKGLG